MALSAAAAKAGLAKAISSVCLSASTPIRRRIINWKAEARIEKLYKQLRQVRKVNTITSMDKAVDLNTFYYPTKVDFKNNLLEEENEVKTVKYIRDLGSENFIVEGTVGQGKSIFFRYLTSQEMYLGVRVPIFLELRRLGGDTLANRVQESVDSLGITGDPAACDHILGSGHAVLLLDGFDEVKDQDKSRVADQIERFAQKYKKCQILVTTRPGSFVSSMPLFTVVSLCEYTSDELPHVINRIAKTSEMAENLIQEIGSAKSNLSTMLTTPLMVSLLVFKYAKTNLFPDTVAEFYGDLFETLYVTHDNTKLGGVDRGKKCDLREVLMRSVFDTFSFLTRYADLTAIPAKDAVRYCKLALQKQAAAASPEDFIEDICKITCLLLREGGDYKYVHKSVQEFHSACYISSLSDDLAEQFYADMHKDFRRWSVELSFLESIDERRFYECFGLGELERLFGSVRKLPSEYKLTPSRLLANSDIRLKRGDVPPGLSNVVGRGVLDPSHIIRVTMTSNNYYLPNIDFWRVGSNQGEWNDLCGQLGLSSARKRVLRSLDFAGNKQALDTVIDWIGGWVGRDRAKINELPAKLRRARKLVRAQSVNHQNPYV